jgi:hypothetical protein
MNGARLHGRAPFFMMRHEIRRPSQLGRIAARGQKPAKSC